MEQTDFLVGTLSLNKFQENIEATPWMKQPYKQQKHKMRTDEICQSHYSLYSGKICYSLTC
jgi:hypothetical protein